MNTKINKQTIALGYSHSIAIGKNGNLYAWGNNGLGQLGTGLEMNEYVPKKVFLENGIKPVSVAAGWFHSMAICDDGNLYSWGNNSYGNLGLGLEKKIMTPQVVDFPKGETPIFITANYDSSVAITDKRNLYAWGYNIYGQLGLDKKYGKIIKKPQLVKLPNGIKPIFAALGEKHLIVLSEDNDIYVCGSNENRQLGLDNFEKYSTFQYLTLPNNEKPISIDANGESTVIITESGHYYVYGEIFGRFNKSLDYLPNEEKAISVVLGKNNFYIFDDNENVYAYGKVFNNFSMNILMYIPKKITLRKGVKPKYVVAGPLHSVIIGDDGKAYACGINDYGQLGTGNRVNQETFQEVDLF